MAAAIEADRNGAIHPLHSILLAFPVALFVAALLSDIAYSSTYEVQWTNFSSWLIAGGLFVGGFTLLWSIIDWVRRRREVRSRSGLYAILLLVTWLLAFLNALIHARDAWGAMPLGLILSAVVAVLALVAAWVGYSSREPK